MEPDREKRSLHAHSLFPDMVFQVIPKYDISNYNAFHYNRRPNNK